MPKRKKSPDTRTHRDRYVAYLNQMTSPTAIVIKKGGTNFSKHRQPMLEQTAVLSLAVYDGLLPLSPEQHLNLLLQDLPRNPRKEGTEATWEISNA